VNSITELLILDFLLGSKCTTSPGESVYWCQLKTSFF